MNSGENAMDKLGELGSRLAAESMLAVPGFDEGLIPAYSLLTQMEEEAGGFPALQESIRPLRQSLDALLSEAKPFTAEAVSQLREFATHWPDLLQNGGKGTTKAQAAASSPPEGAEEEELVIDPSVNTELLQEFYAESMDHLQQIEASLLELEHNPDNQENLNAIFRSFHTLKGISGFLQLQPLHHLSHEVESLLDLVRNHQIELTQEMISLVLLCRDTIKDMVDKVGECLSQGKRHVQRVSLEHLLSRLAQSAAKEDKSVPNQPVQMAKSKNGEGGTAKDASLLEKAKAVVAASVSDQLLSAVNPSAQASSSGQRHNTTVAAGTTVRVNTEKLDSLMDVVGELVIVQSQLQEWSKIEGGQNIGHLQRALSQMTRITKDLQYTSMALRMVPLKNTFQKMERLAREIALKLDKPMVFQTSGESTELDRTMVEMIHDPLVHLVRNSVDHGLEERKERLATGKSEKGCISINAFHHGGSIHIEISDDGRGINPEVIYRKGLEKGLVRENESLSKAEILNLLFAPGFSTAKQVTDISGRGVGLDVVRKNIEQLRGKIEVESELGRGSTFRLKLPLTTAIIDGLVVKVGPERFILPTNSVVMTLRPTREQCHSLIGKGELLTIRGQTMPLFRLHKAFAIENAVRHPWEGLVAILEASGRSTALLVDEILNKQEVVIKNLGPLVQSFKGISGGTIMGDGTVALILEPSYFFRKAA